MCFHVCVALCKLRCYIDIAYYFYYLLYGEEFQVLSLVRLSIPLGVGIEVSVVC